MTANFYFAFVTFTSAEDAAKVLPDYRYPTINGRMVRVIPFSSRLLTHVGQNDHEGDV